MNHSHRFSLCHLVLILVVDCLCGGQLFATDFNVGWRFHLGDVAGAQRPEFDDAAWGLLDLPHDWGIALPRDPQLAEGASVGFFPGGIGWYRKEFTVPAAQAGRAV